MLIATQTTKARVHIEPGFSWDGQQAYLFDIDGTLLRSRDRIHFDAFASSILQVTGTAVSLEGVSVHGSTDTAILRDACRLAQLPDSFLEPNLAAILAAMSRTVAERRGDMDLLLMPGVEAALAHLARRGALLGLGTGNLEKIGWIKIEEAGLRPWFRFGGFSDSFPVRDELIGDAARQARELAGSSATVCVVGDTPRDVQAARANSLPAIAVATGHYGFDELLECRPAVCATSLADLLAFAGAAQ
jgi:phosphoglycolate phosphatase